MYIVRDNYLINATVDCFDKEDYTEIKIDGDGGFIKYKWLK